MTDELKLLIVDDSLIFRSAIQEAVKGENGLKVVGSVRNGVKAMEFIEATPPDIVSLDVEMPEMDGLETLKAIQEYNSEHGTEIGVIMVSSHTHKGADTTIQALDEGAFDFVTKPASDSARESVEILRNNLLVKIRSFAVKRKRGGKAPAKAAAPRPEAKPPAMAQPAAPHEAQKVSAIVIGVSTGGPKALSAMMPILSEKVDVPIFIVQHMPPLFTQSLAENLDSKCRHTVKEAADGDVAQMGHAYLAPGGKHMVLRKTGKNQILIGTNTQPPENGCRPAADVLFRTAASVYGGDIIALVLTGMGSDGAKGLGPLKREGAYVIVQDEETSVVWGMPGSAVEAGHVDEVVALLKIPDAVEKAILKG